MGNAHTEVGALQQAADKGLLKGADAVGQATLIHTTFLGGKVNLTLKRKK